jgi:hypothetical protein
MAIEAELEDDLANGLIPPVKQAATSSAWSSPEV